MKNQDENNNEIGLQQTNSIFQIWRQLKNSIFNVLFVLLNQTDDGQDQSLVGLAFEVGIDYLQMMAFPFNSAIIGVWNGGETLTSFLFIFTNLSFNQFIPGVGFSTFLIMLYLLISIIILVILDIIYVSYSFSKKKFKYTWPLIFLAKVVPLCVTVFFLPIMQTLLSVASCQNSEDNPGIQVMQSFPDVICWQGWHMFHAFTTLFFTSIYVFIASIVALTIFQPRMTTNKFTARQSSTGQVIFIVMKMICQFVFSFTPFDNTWIYCIMLFVLSGWLWTAYNIDQPIYNKNASKFFRICSSYFFWTNLMLFVSQALMGYGFEGGLIIWMCGLPFIAIIIIFQRKSNIDKLFSSNLKFRSGEQLQDHIQYVLQLIHNRDKDKNSYMLLLGYIEKHIEICMQQDCPLKVKKLKKQEDLPQIQENCRKLIKQLLRMYRQGIKKYPNCTKLRLSLAFFYMQKLYNNKKAYEQFTVAQNTDPTFGQQFIIYRFKKIIRENLQQNQQEDDSDLIQIIKFDNHVSLCQQAMLLSARLHKDFWTELQQQAPDLKKLNSIGSKITQTTINVKQNYKQVQKINSHVSQVVHNYAIYLIFIGQSHMQGKKILQQAKRIYMQKKQAQQNDIGIFTLKNSEYGDLTNIEQSYNSLIKVSADEETLGKIIYANDAFTELTGYIKEDITERTIDKILPSVFSFHHKNVMKMWLSDENKKVLANNNSYMTNPHNGFVRQKNGFIMPINYRVSFNTEENCFLAIMRTDPLSYIDFNCKIYVVTDPNGGIKDISTLGYMFFRIGRQQCQNNSYTIEDLGIPENLSKQQLFSKSGVSISLKQVYQVRQLKSNTFTHKTLHLKSEEDSFKNSILQSNDQQKQNLKQKQEQFNVRAEQVWIQASQDLQEVLDDQNIYANGKLKVGYVYILQKIRFDIHVTQNQQKNTELNVFDYLMQEMYQEDQRYIFDDIDDPEEVSRQKKCKILANMLIDMNDGKAVSFEQKKFRNYGEELKIKTYRYFNNDFIRIYGIELQNDENNQYQYSNDDLCGRKDVQRLQKKHYQDKVREAINTSIEHQEIVCLKKYSFFFFLIMCGLSVISFVLSIQQFDKIQVFTNLNYQRAKDTQFIANIVESSINDLIYKGSDIFLNMTLDEIKQYQLTFDPDINVWMQLQNKRVEKKSLLESMNIIQARIINYFDQQSISKNVSIAYQNFLLSIYPVLEEFNIQPNVNITYVAAITALIIVNSLFMVIIWIFNIMKIDQKRFDIMIWFLDIPIDYVVYLQNNCNRFIKNYTPIKELQQKGITMDQKQHYYDEFQEKIKQEDQEVDQQNKARKIMIARHRKKTFMSRFNCTYLTTLWLLIYSSVVTILFCVEISFTKASIQLIDNQWDIVNQQYLWSCALPMSLSLQTLNYQSFTNTYNYKNLTVFSQYLRSNFLNTLTKHNNVDDIKSLIEYTPQIADIYSKAYYGDLCELVSSFDNQTVLQQQCYEMLNQKLRAGITTYQSYLINYNVQDTKDIVDAHYLVVGPAMMIILDKWKNYFLDYVSSFKAYSNVIIYLYIFFTFLGYVTLWMIYLRNQNTKMNQTIQMLNMIPMQMLPKNRKDTRDFLNWLIQQANQKKQTQEN